MIVKFCYHHDSTVLHITIMIAITIINSVATLNARSAGIEIAGIAKYFFCYIAM